MRDQELWARLSAYEFDGAGSAPYSVKLARAEGWSQAFTLRVIEEYRRFLYLTQISARQVTPSQIVDVAWHMHLTFTRDYWDDLCPNVIGKPVHHQPCAGEEEMPRYRDQFAATKALYEAEFGAEPPADVWRRDALPRRRPVRGFVLSEVGSMGPAPQLLLALGLAVLTAYFWVTEVEALLIAVAFIGAIWLGMAGLIRLGRIKGDLARRRNNGDVGVGGGAWWFTYESDDPNFEAGGGMFGGNGDGGGDSGGDGGGCGGCGS